MELSPLFLIRPVFRPIKKVPDARRARNRRAEAYLTSTLERVDRSATKQVGFFHRPVSLLQYFCQLFLESQTFATFALEVGSHRLSRILKFDPVLPQILRQ